ncbi:hypothetical protein [Bradyrhizobium retamae]|uniref:hypothetical protein n=1 Tax=Bradyrhizobium retamae TaxID=1300035 RepID=UPI001FD9F744|nr:hypothetical protein [Bradyrhizobium retamae]
MSEPTVDMVVDILRIPALQARMLGAVWKGKGHPVSTEAIIAAMDRATDVKAHTYDDFKFSLCHLRKRLKRVGIAIPNAGYAQGYYLKFPSKGQLHV